MYKTIPVSEIPENSPVNRARPRTQIDIEFEALSSALAMFVPLENGQTITQLRSQATNLRNHFKDRKVHSRTSPEKDGVYFWWEYLNV